MKLLEGFEQNTHMISLMSSKDLSAVVENRRQGGGGTWGDGGVRREIGREASVEIRGGGDGGLSWSSSRPGDENGLEYERISKVKPSGLAGWI